ncbi:DNA primase [Bacteroidia bacterium]|nr:DNA primase [Bacteroidia bacterium]
MIDNATIERIYSAVRIYDIVSDFITLRKRGINYVGLCPFHEDKTPSFYVSPAKNICKCFACGEGGTAVHFVMKLEQLSYVEALKYLAKKYGIEVKETELTNEQKQEQDDKESMFILNAYAQKVFSTNLLETREGKAIGLSYFHERGFRDDIIRKFQLGYSLEERDAFSKQALQAGYKKQFLEKTGLAVTGENNYMADRFRGRVMFPVHALSGKVVAFGGRILKNEKTAKYVNSPESEIYSKSNELYGIYFARQAIVKQDCCFLVEGYTDVISMYQAGIENVVASSGTSLTQGQIRMIHRFTNNVTILYDGDSAGIKAALRGINLLLEVGLNIKIVLLPEGEDPDSFARKQNASSFQSFIKENETDFVRFKAGLLMKEAGNDPVKKAQTITEIVDTIALIPEEIIRLMYIKECERITGVNEATLVRAIAKKRQEIIVQKKKTVYPQTENPEGNQPVGEEPIPPANNAALQAAFDAIKGLEEFERAILYYIVRYGEFDMANINNENDKEKNNSIFVIQYIMEELEEDELKLSNFRYQQILDETYKNYRNEGFRSEEFFRNHYDPEISKIAVDLSTNKYIESKIHSKYKYVPGEEEKLIDMVPYIVINYKNALLQTRIDEINSSIKEAEKDGDLNRMTELIKELQEWNQKKKVIAPLLRERIITKI